MNQAFEIKANIAPPGVVEDNRIHVLIEVTGIPQYPCWVLFLRDDGTVVDRTCVHRHRFDELQSHAIGEAFRISVCQDEQGKKVMMSNRFICARNPSNNETYVIVIGR